MFYYIFTPCKLWHMLEYSCVQCPPSGHSRPFPVATAYPGGLLSSQGKSHGAPKGPTGVAFSSGVPSMPSVLAEGLAGTHMRRRTWGALVVWQGPHHSGLRRSTRAFVHLACILYSKPLSEGPISSSHPCNHKGFCEWG